MINFTNCKEVFSNYAGSEKKKKIIYNNEYYLLKFPDPVRSKKNIFLYANNTISEYIGCKIFKEVGIDTQEVILGKYVENNEDDIVREKIVVACKDFTTTSKKLIEFSSLSNSITKYDYRFKCDIKDVYEILDNLPIDKQMVIDKFWDMFVIDTLIANTDRHLSNWGFLEENNNLEFAPIYDCGSSLHPLVEDDAMFIILSDATFFKSEVFNIHPAITYYGNHLSYNEFYQENIEELNKALMRIMPRINMEQIYKIIDEVEGIASIRKEFFKNSILYRYKYILIPAYNRLLKN